jgi:hypothetical protein
MNNMWLGISLAIALFIVTNTSSIVPTAEERIQFYVNYLLQLAPPYVWGGYWGILGGDCSGQVAWVLKMSGIGGYPRTTALRMWLMWPHKKKIVNNTEMWQSAKFPNIGWYTFPTKKTPRPYGHVWIVLDNDGNKLDFAEASSGKGYFKKTCMTKGDSRDKYWVGVMELNLTPGFTKEE